MLIVIQLNILIEYFQDALLSDYKIFKREILCCPNREKL